MHAGLDFERLYCDVSPAVVSVYAAPGGAGTGSGFVYERTPGGDGYVVTNHHVVAGLGARGAAVDDPDRVDLRFVDGEWREGGVVGVDAYTDLAVVGVSDLPGSATPLTVASEAPSPGRPVAALGNPMGLDGTMTVGYVSGVNRSMPTASGFAIPDVVQTDAPINPGNSGGPLVAVAVDADPDDPAYEVVGVNRARQGDNIGFAVSPAVVDRVVPSLIRAGRHRHPYLRVRTLDVSPTVAEANDLDDARGVLVVEAPSGSGLRGADRATDVGDRAVPVGGDVLVAIDGVPVRTHEDLMRYLVLERAPGESVALDLLRDGEPHTTTVELAERPAAGDDDGGSRVPVR